MFNFSKSKKPNDAGMGTGFSASLQTKKPVLPLPMSNIITKNVIDNVADFPTYLRILTLPTATEQGLRLGNDIKKYLIAVETSSNKSVIVFDPTKIQLLRSHLPLLRQSVRSISTFMQEDEDCHATESVISKIYENNEAIEKTSGIRSANSSTGAALFKQWAETAVKFNATDLHINSIGNGRGRVTMFVNGELEAIDEASNGIFTSKDVEDAMTAGLNMAETGTNKGAAFQRGSMHNCMIGKDLGIPNIRLRYTSLNGDIGPAVVCRILHTDLNAPPMPYTDMGLSNSHIAILHQAQRLTSGMNIFAGETGSGKTTLGKTFIELHPLNGRIAMYGVYDPLEYPIRNCHQTSVPRDVAEQFTGDKKSPYEAAIIQIMRMNPRMLDGGEVRDNISGVACMSMAQSGHLSICTLHADHIVGILPRLTSPGIGLNRSDLTSGNALGLMTYQKLVPKLCSCATDIKTAYTAHSAKGEVAHALYLQTLHKSLAGLNIPIDSMRFVNKEGCTLCRKKGVKGLTMLMELMIPDSDWREYSSKGESRKAMQSWRSNYSDKRLDTDNFSGKPIIEHAIYQSIQGVIDPRNIEKFGLLQFHEIVK